MKTLSDNLKLLVCIALIMFASSMFKSSAQDYFLTFSGAGAGSTVDSIRVENLNQNTKLTLNGTDVLHLKAITTDIETINGNRYNKIKIYPNPVKDIARIQFNLPESGATKISIYDLTGKEIYSIEEFLLQGQHSFLLHGISEGMFLVKVNSGRNSYSGKLISTESGVAEVRVSLESTNNISETELSYEESDHSKGVNEEKVILFEPNDWFKMTGFFATDTNAYSTVIAVNVSDLSNTNSEMTFDFISCTDGDGNHYPVVQIGSVKGSFNNSDKSVQIWMAENLKTTKYRNKTPIPEIADANEWINLKGPGYCWYQNDAGYKDVYGALYNWHTIAQGNLCPIGWHVPSDAEWKALTDFLIGEKVAGGKLKETTFINWYKPNLDATNETGFTARPGGYRDPSGGFGGMRSFGHWWSSSEYSTAQARSRYLSSGSGEVFNFAYYKEYGFSVRCLKD